jgi:hypothetical protein
MSVSMALEELYGSGRFAVQFEHRFLQCCDSFIVLQSVSNLFIVFIFADCFRNVFYSDWMRIDIPL